MLARSGPSAEDIGSRRAYHSSRRRVDRAQTSSDHATADEPRNRHRPRRHPNPIKAAGDQLEALQRDARAARSPKWLVFDTPLARIGCTRTTRGRNLSLEEQQDRSAYRGTANLGPTRPGETGRPAVDGLGVGHDRVCALYAGPDRHLVRSDDLDRAYPACPVDHPVPDHDVDRAESQPSVSPELHEERFAIAMPVAQGIFHGNNHAMRS